MTTRNACCVTLFQPSALSRTVSYQRIRPCAEFHVTNANGLQNEAFII